MPTKRRRHAVTETPPVEAALDDLRREMGDAGRIELGELVILGAREKVARIRSERAGAARLRQQLSDRIRAREPMVDLDAAEEVRRSGWVRP